MLIKSILTTLALSTAPLWLSGVWPGSAERAVAVRCGERPCCDLPACCKAPACCKTVAVASSAPCRLASAGDAVPLHAVVRCADVVKTDGEAPRAVAVYAATPGVASAMATATQTIAFAGEGEGDGAWLGVQIAEVPQALSAQLNLDGRGLIITNVVEDSPAERAGLKPHDVVVSFDGQTVGADAVELSRMVGEQEPNTDVTISILRSGEPQTIEVTLGARPGQYAWRFQPETGDDETIEDTFHSTGRVILQGPTGEWVVKELKELDELGDDIKAIIPDVGTTSTFVHKGNGEHSFEIHISHDGEDIKVSRKDGGDITVTRRDDDGEETTTVYDSEDALRDADEEAFNVYKGHPHGALAFNFNSDGVADLHMKLDGLEFNAEELHERIQEQIAKAHESAKGALEGLHDLHLEFDGTNVNWPDILKNHNQWREHFDASQNAFAFQIGKPRHTFEVKDDGSIEVRIRSGDSELLRTFPSADDLADRNPRLYEKYQKLIEADQDE
jgi:hypothetical protein